MTPASIIANGGKRMITEKGTAVKTSQDYFRNTYGEDTWLAVLGRLTPEERDLTENVHRVTAYPVYIDGKVFSSIVDIVFDGDRMGAERGLRAGGHHEADSMLDGVFSIFARFVSPQQAFSRAGSILTSVYNGVDYETVPASDGNGGTLVIRGLGELTYIAPWLCGWMERALQRFGATSASVRERAWDAGHVASNELAFEMRWE